MKSFYHHIMKPLIIGIVILVLTLALASIIYMNRIITPDIEKLASEILSLKVAEIDNWLNRHINTSENLATILAEIPLNTDNRESVLAILDNKKQQTVNEYESLGFITLEGEKYLTNGSHFSVKNRDYYQQLVNEPNRTHLSMNINSQANAAQVVLIVSKVFNQQNELTGYVSLALPLSYIQESVTSSNNLYSTYIYHAKTKQALIGKTFETTSFVSMDKAIPSNSNWRIKLAISRKNVLLSLDKTFIFIAFLAIILTTLFMFLMRNRLAKITQPIEALEQMMAATSDGNYLDINPNQDIMELNHIGLTYNKMVANIHDQQAVIRQQAQQKNEAEHQALYAQIKPHFLYNTLETIQSMAYDLDSELIEEAIGDLATFYRIGLSSDAQIITISQECQHIESYLNILRLRYNNLFTYQLNNQVDKTQLFLKFTIQPLVENAIYHGIKPLGTQGHIDIVVEETDNDISVKVINPAPNLTSEDVSSINQQLQTSTINDSYGLYNVNQRLKLRFGAQYGVTVYLDNHSFIAMIRQPKIKEGALQ